jgi:hypothetical protein
MLAVLLKSAELSDSVPVETKSTTRWIASIADIILMAPTLSGYISHLGYRNWVKA